MTDPKKYIYTLTDDPNHSASKIFAYLGHGKSVLEVGCASGIQTQYLKEQLGCQVTGIEVEPLAAENARPFCEKLIVGSIEDLELDHVLGDKRFDAIIFADVLEHLYDPLNALKKVRSFLNAEGCLIASIPNIAHEAVCWELAHGRFDYQEYGLLDETHIRFFTKKNVARLFEAAGLWIESWDRVIKTAQKTEFSVHCGSAQEQSFLDWIREQNAEANTYQFIVKARLICDGLQESSYRQLETLDAIRKLESRLDESKQQNMLLKSQISWMEKHRFGPITGFINRMRLIGRKSN